MSKSRTEIINELIVKNNYESYLEIGVQSGKNFLAVECKSKVGVDPDTTSRATINMDSDSFFEFKNKKAPNEKFDIIFIDGLHECEQVFRDITNALLCLSKNGTIICHDMNPQDENSQKVPRIQSHWNGDCWKAWVWLRNERKDLNMRVIDTDEGCGIITFGNQELLNVDCELTYENLNKNRVEWLNLVSG